MGPDFSYVILIVDNKKDSEQGNDEVNKKADSIGAQVNCAVNSIAICKS